MESVFGPEWANLLGGGPGGPVGPLITQLFQIYNAAVILVTALLVGYAVWSSTVQTAHEGKSMGKRYSSLWTPLRMVFGATLTAPMFGVSLVQIIILSITAFSFFTADSMAKVITGFISQGGNVAISSTFMDTPKANEITAGLIMSQTCVDFKNKEALQYPASDGIDLIIPKWIGSKFTFGAESFFLGDSDCGKLIINHNAANNNKKYLDMIKIGVTKMQQKIKPAVKGIITDKEFIQTSYFNDAILSYEEMYDEVRASALADANADLTERINKMTSEIESKGWISLGVWYYEILSISATREQAIQISAEVIPPKVTEVDTEIGGMAEYINNAAHYIEKASGETGSSYAVFSKSDNENIFSKELSTTVSDIIYKDGDPFLKIVNIGQSVLNFGLVIWGATTAVELGSNFLKIFSDGMAETVKSAAGLIKAIGIVCILIGAWLGWYIPMMPFMVWVVGVIGVFIGVIQSLFASQIWGASHAMPEGEGIAGRHAVQGYMLVISLALRPVLIVLGFIFSYFILWAGSWLSIEGLKVYISSIHTGGWNSVIAIFVAIAVSAILVTTILHRSLGFIFEAADDVLTWIGGGRQLGSESQSAQRAMSAFGMIINHSGANQFMRKMSGTARSLNAAQKSKNEIIK